MELSRKEYPAMLDSLQPTQAVNVLNERIRHVSKLNTEIADWLQERRRVEELYVQGLRKLANKQLPEDSPDLGVFATPWKKIVSSCESVAESHQILAQKIETDIERPLREFSSTNRDMQAMATISGNLASMAKEIDASQRKADKLKLKGEKAAAGKVASATSEVENAQSQWDSQAPYVFEKLQDVDESRCDRLRDLLTQFQTHEVDQVERNRVSAEDCLNATLNIETADEIKTWAAKVISGKPKLERPQPPKPPSSSGGGLAPPPISTPSRRNEDDSSQRSGSSEAVFSRPRSNKANTAPAQEQKSSGLHGLNRFKTVLGRRRQSTMPYSKGGSPERKTSSTNLGSSFFGKGKNKDATKIPDRPASPSRRLSEQRSQIASRASDMSASPKASRQSGQSADRPNGTAETSEAGPSTDLMNGTKSTIPELQEPLQPSSPTAPAAEPTKDAEGFSVPSNALDAISQAEKEAKEAQEDESTTEAPTQQFKVDIRNAPIPEEDAVDAENAIANVANTLRAQAAPLRKSGTIRGRRAGDVRNTMFIPSDTPIPGLPSLAAPSMTAAQASPPIPQPSPLLAHRSTFTSDYTGSDTQSVRSGRSLSSYASATVRHPDMHEPGLNSSIVETVSTWFESGQITKAMVIGQVALAFNPLDLSSAFGTDTIRLENFPVLEKVAPNPAFLEQVPDKPGTYTVDLAKITKTSVAFHYQVHLENNNIAVFSPVVISSAWKVESTQASAILNYSLNSLFTLPANTTSITLNNLIILLRLDSTGAKATNAQSKPVGTFARERSLIYWRLGDVTFSADQPAHQLRVRFFTEGEAKPGNAEARWEIAGDTKNLGSGLAVSKIVEGTTSEEKEKDPFADEDGANDKEATEKSWKEIPAVKKICSGTYVATQ